nr:SAM-dependent methyltransferase [Arenimonas sp.]
LWHDRAVSHFLTTGEATARYAAQAARALPPGGQAVIGGFAPDGPERCSGLPVARRSARDIADFLGNAFELVEERQEVHQTPGGAMQAFAWARLLRTGLDPA